VPGAPTDKEKPRQEGFIAQKACDGKAYLTSRTPFGMTESESGSNGSGGVVVGVEGGGLSEGVGDGGAGDEAGAAAEGEVLEAPLDEDEDTAFEFDDVDEMDEEPDKPGGEAGEVNAEDVGDGGGASDDGHFSFVEVMEARGRSFAGQARGDDLGGETAALDGNLSDAMKWLALFVCGVGKITNDENLGMAGNGEIGLDFDAAGAIGFGVEALGDFLGERSGGDTAGPEDSARGKRVVVISVFVGDAYGGDVRDEDIFHDLDTEVSDERFGFGGKIFGIDVEDAVAAFHEEDAGFFGMNVAEIVAQGFPGDFGKGTSELEAGGTGANNDKGEPGAGFGGIGGALGALKGVEEFVADGSGFFEGLEAGSGFAPIVIAVVGGLRAGGDDEGVVGIFGGVAEMDELFGGVDVHGFAQEDLGVFLTAEDGAQGGSDLAGRERAGGYLVEESLEEMEIALIDESDLGVGALQGARGDEAAETAAEDDDAMGVGHGDCGPTILEEKRRGMGAWAREFES